MPKRVLVDRTGDSNANVYGQFFWHVELTEGGFVTLFADRAEVVNGAVVFYGGPRDLAEEGPAGKPAPELVLLSLAGGYWSSFFAASMLPDGRPVAVERWEEGKD
jgi:hypothetical protein